MATWRGQYINKRTTLSRLLRRPMMAYRVNERHCHSADTGRPYPIISAQYQCQSPAGNRIPVNCFRRYSVICRFDQFIRGRSTKPREFLHKFSDSLGDVSRQNKQRSGHVQRCEDGLRLSFSANNAYFYVGACRVYYSVVCFVTMHVILLVINRCFERVTEVLLCWKQLDTHRSKIADLFSNVNKIEKRLTCTHVRVECFLKCKLYPSTP